MHLLVANQGPPLLDPLSEPQSLSRRYVCSYSNHHIRTEVDRKHLVTQWRVSVVNGGNNTYVIHASGDLPPLGWSIDPTEHFQTGSPVVSVTPPKEFLIRFVPEESRGPEEQAFT